MTFSEAEYVEYLRDERVTYAWVMQHYGGRTPVEARVGALEFYGYEPPDTPFRGLVFHDLSWHWAMLGIHGGDYWNTHPELADPPAEYDALCSEHCGSVENAWAEPRQAD